MMTRYDAGDRGEILIEALPYIQKFNQKIIVVKYGGNAMTDEALKLSVMRDMVLLNIVGIRAVLVHGGGPEISGLLKRLSIESRFINGLRYTTAETAEVANMVLSGKVNKGLVSLIRRCGGKAIGLCGMDGDLLLAKKMESDPDLGFVGEVVRVNPAPVLMALEKGMIPVIATAAADEKGQLYNINADTAAAAIAGALRAEKLISMTDTPGILRDRRDESSLIREIGIREVPALLADGIADGGMIPKVESCLKAIESGVREAVIIDGRKKHSILLELFSDEGVGTLITAEPAAVASGISAAGQKPAAGQESVPEAEAGQSDKNGKKEENRAAALMDRDRKTILGTYRRNPLVIAEGAGAVCRSDSGREYIDFTSGIGVNSLGFCEPGWAEAVAAQARKLQHTSNLYYTEPCVRLAEALTRGSHLQAVFFANSGAEANEAAIKAARKYGNDRSGSSRSEIVTLNHSFHGRTLAAITATGQEEYHRFFNPFPAGFAYADGEDPDDLERKITENTCAVMMELIQGEGGVRTLDSAYVRKAEALCREHDLLLIADEVQTGIGRTGYRFAFEAYGIKPNIVTAAKGLGGGLPVGAALFDEKARSILGFGDHGSTFGGNPVVCAGAEYVLNSIDEEFLNEVSRKGDRIRSALEAMEGVSDISGMGLMIGFRAEGAEPAEVAAAALEEGLLILTAKDKIRLLPPLNIDDTSLEKGLVILERAVSRKIRENREKPGEKK